MNQVRSLHKVECAFSMVITSEFRMGRHRDDHQEDAPHYSRSLIISEPTLFDQTVSLTSNCFFRKLVKFRRSKRLKMKNVLCDFQASHSQTSCRMIMISKNYKNNQNLAFLSVWMIFNQSHSIF